MQACISPRTTLRRISARLRQERGQALVEFALVLPVLILIILGILYFGRFEDYSNQETQLAAQGARWAATDNNPSTTVTLQNYVQAQASPELQAGSSDVTTPAKVWIYYPTGSSNAVGNSVRVCVAATVQYPFFSGSSTIVEYATMRIEQLQTASEWSTSNNPTGMPSGCPTS
jgi:Flp pilus assembly protein TadG